MTRIESSELESDIGEGLTRAAPGPEAGGRWDSCELESETPAANAREEMTLSKNCKIGCIDFGDRAFIDDAVGDQFAGDQFPEPRGGVGAIFVIPVEGFHW